MADLIKHPPHYMHGPSGVECKEACAGLVGRSAIAFRYVFRAGAKGPALEDLKKAREVMSWPVDPPWEKVRAICNAEPDPVKSAGLMAVATGAQATAIQYIDEMIAREEARIARESD